MPIRTVSEAIREATVQLLQESPEYYVIGEGITDEKGAFGTTLDLHKEFPSRVFDMPISENGITGVALGTAIAGMRPIMVHMRTDFLLYAADQLINNAAKWYGMFGGRAGTAPLVIRAVIGRGWGQGMQHSQHLERMFADIEGLTVVCPSNAFDAKGLLMEAAHTNGPVLFLEHRWIHDMKCEVPAEPYRLSLHDRKVLRDGDDFTLISYGYMVHECMKAAEFLSEQGIEVAVIDERKPLDHDIDQIGVLGITEKSNCSPAPSCSKFFYPNVHSICNRVADLVGRVPSVDLTKAYEYTWSKPHDVPNADFRGPF